MMVPYPLQCAGGENARRVRPLLDRSARPDRPTLVASDRKLLYRATREAGRPDLRYAHRRAAVEQLLALPDAIAWCWAKGGDWRRRIQPVVAHVREV